MQITISLQTLAIIMALIFPVITGGTTYISYTMFLRMWSRERLEKHINADIEFRKKLETISTGYYYLATLSLPVFEELVFRLVPVYLLYYFEVVTLRNFILTGVITSLLFGLPHYFNHRSLGLSLCVEALGGCIIFAGFVLFVNAFGFTIAFILIVVVHLLHNFLFTNIFLRMKSYGKESYMIRDYYQVFTNRNLDKEFDEEWKKEKERMDKADEELLIVSSGNS